MTDNLHITEIYSPRYEGERFKSHSFPLDLIEDLYVLREMTIEMAKQIYFEKHPDRKRIPKNFTRDISFELRDISPGSTIPTIILVTGLSGMFPQQNYNYFIEAPARIVKAIEVAHSGKSNITDFANAEVLRHFDQFGKKLRDGESINFSQDRGTSQSVLNKESRKRLLLASSKAKEYTESVVLRGLIASLDKDRGSFEIQFPNGLKVKGDYDEGQTKSLEEALVGFEDGQKVLIRATGTYSATDKLKSIQDIEELGLLDEFDVPSRLEELSLLKVGWLDGSQGESLSTDGVRWLSETFEKYYDSDNLPLPAAYPTPDGNVQFEWSLGAWEVSLEVDLASKNSEYFGFNTATNDEKSCPLDLNEEVNWRELNDFLLEITSKT